MPMTVWPREKIYYDRETVLVTRLFFPAPQSILGQMSILATHPRQDCTGTSQEVPALVTMLSFTWGLSQKSRQRRQPAYNVTIVWCRGLLPASNVSMTLTTRVPQDNEESRLFGVYEASSAQEHIAASRLLNWHHSLSHPGYVKLLSDLRVIRMACNEDMLAILAHHENMLGFPRLR
jgi:hypothetical protein